MKFSVLSSGSQKSFAFWQRLKSGAPLLISLLVTLLSALLVFNQAIAGNLLSILIGLGLDPLRGHFVGALLSTAVIAFTGALVGRRRLGAMLGAAIVFIFDYLISFILLEQQPQHDPGGRLEALNAWALAHTSLVMLALACLCAFTGAVVGRALSEVLFDPFYHGLRFLWQRHKNAKMQQANWPNKHDEYAHTPANAKLHSLTSWLAALIMLLLLLLASSSASLFVYSPDVGLHSSPALVGKSGLPAHGTLVEDSLVSPTLGGQRKPFLVYLPPAYNTSQGRTNRFPTLYLLHGSPGRDSDWVTGAKADQSADTLITLGKAPELILVFPDGNGRPGETSEWGNSADGRQLMETYVARDLVQYVDQKYRTIPQARYRGIGGNSMGGFGATNIAVHHPDIFGFVISFGGYYQAEGSIWGKNPAVLQANSPLEVLPSDSQAWGLHLYIGAATQDQPYYTDSIKFVQELSALHIDHIFDVEQGYHAWGVWEIQFYHALQWLHNLLT